MYHHLDIHLNQFIIHHFRNQTYRTILDQLLYRHALHYCYCCCYRLNYCCQTTVLLPRYLNSHHFCNRMISYVQRVMFQCIGSLLNKYAVFEVADNTTSIQNVVHWDVFICEMVRQNKSFVFFRNTKDIDQLIYRRRKFMGKGRPFL